ncbi:hypothetical protein [Tateyamaria sp.]|uniref:hypothetical protein n=1 Tax=Tateyamaria sp. TaxID=1929288 RepID=UPI00329BB3DB
MTSSIYLIGTPNEPAQDIVDQLAASSLNTLILEAGNLTETSVDLNGNGETDDFVVGDARYTTTQVDDLVSGPNGADERTVLAYVNAAVTDHNRFYWDNTWVPNPDDAGNPDAGPVDVSVAPPWLAMPLGTAGGPVFDAQGQVSDGTFGYIVDYRDDAWQRIVINQSIAYIEHGFNGIFLDDVGRYDETTLGQSEAAEEMMRLVVRVQNDVMAATGLSQDDLHITINSDSFIVSNYFFGEDAPDSFDLDLVRSFITAVDGLVMEGITADNTDFWGTANTFFNGTVTDPNGAFIGIDETALTAIETPTDWTTMMAIIDELLAQNVTLFLAPDQAYDTVLDAPIFGNVSDDTLVGTSRSEAIFGRGGADIIDGGDGDDIIYGGESGSTIHGGDGDDLIYGGPGDDLIFAGNGNDTIYGGGGNDTIIGGSGSDMIYGEAGDDLISGGASGDLLSGGNGNDIIYGGDLPDTFVFDF